MQHADTTHQHFNVFIYIWYWFISRRPTFIFTVGMLSGVVMTLSVMLSVVDIAEMTEPSYGAQMNAAVIPAPATMIPSHYAMVEMQAEQAEAQAKAETPVTPQTTTEVAAVSSEPLVLAPLPPPLPFDTIPAPAQKPTPDVQSIRVGLMAKSSIADVLASHGAEEMQAKSVEKALTKQFSLSKISREHSLSARLERDKATGLQYVKEATLHLSPEKVVKIAAQADGSFKATTRDVVLKRKVSRVAGRVTSSFLQAGADAGIPMQMMMQLINAFSYDVDFQRDIQPNDKLHVLFERFYTEDGDFVRNGDLLYASLEQRNEKVTLYKYKSSDGDTAFFHEDGRNVKKSMLKTPMDGARISSGFGLRKHPILGYSKMHRGVDFSAPSGTPVYAAGDGVVEMAARNGGYGNYVRIRHQSGYASAYGHLQGFAKKLSQGDKVKQGQIIGYVGTTGMSTGPHLHYEILANGMQVNPVQVKFMTSDKLSGKQLAAFKRHKNEIQQMIAALPKEDKLASLR